MIDTIELSALMRQGTDLDELYITTAWWDLTEEQRKEQPWAGDLLCVHTGIRGLVEPAAHRRRPRRPGSRGRVAGTGGEKCGAL